MRGHLWAGRFLIGAVVVSVLGGCQSSAAPSASLASPTATISAAHASEADVGRQWLEALQAKDVDAMAALWAPDGVWQDGATGETFSGGPQAEHAGSDVATSMMIAANDASVLALGDGVAVVAYTFHGPTPASSSPIDVPMITVLRIKDGKITGETIYYNPRLAYGS